MTPRVSVVIPCYNLGEYIDEAVESALAQTYQDFEIVIVDDGSTDEFTAKILDSYDKPKTRVIRTKNNGVCHARNTGIGEARGEYILPLDADDKIAGTYMQKAVGVLDASIEFGIVYCETEYFGDKTGRFDVPEYDLSKMLLGNLIHVSAVFRKSDWEAVKGYNPNAVGGMEDYDFWLSIIGLGRSVFRIPEVLYYWRQRPDSRHNSRSREQYIRAYSQIIRNHPGLYLDHVDYLVEYIVDLNERSFQ